MDEETAAILKNSRFTQDFLIRPIEEKLPICGGYTALETKVCLAFNSLPSENHFKSHYRRSRCGAAEMHPTGSHEVAGSITGLTQWVKYLGCHELWCRSQKRLGSGVAVAVA